jgi:hypothetical protein
MFDKKHCSYICAQHAVDPTALKLFADGNAHELLAVYLLGCGTRRCRRGTMMLRRWMRWIQLTESKWSLSRCRQSWSRSRHLASVCCSPTRSPADLKLKWGLPLLPCSRRPLSTSAQLLLGSDGMACNLVCDDAPASPRRPAAAGAGRRLSSRRPCRASWCAHRCADCSVAATPLPLTHNPAQDTAQVV